MLRLIRFETDGGTPIEIEKKNIIAILIGFSSLISF